MISVDIEKEIQQPNKVILGLTIRQCVATIVPLLLTALMYVIFRSFDILIYSAIIFSPIAFLFGWFKRDGLVGERYILKLIKERIYKNSKRAYKTKNRYVVLMNKEYRRHQIRDMADKTIAKSIQKERKENQKRVHTSSLKAIQ